MARFGADAGCFGGLPDHGKGRKQVRETGGRRALQALISAPLHWFGVLTLLLAVASCSRVEVSDKDADASSSVRTGPPPQYSAEYQALFRPFVHCASRALTRKQTIRLAYNDEAGLARLAAYT